MTSYTATEAFGGSLAGHREIATVSDGLRCECGRLYSTPRALEQHHEGVERDRKLDAARSKPATYGGKTDAALALVSTLKLTRRDFAALAVACADQAGLARAGQEELAAELELVFRDGTVLLCWACGAPGAIVRVEVPAERQIACASCDEADRMTASARAPGGAR